MSFIRKKKLSPLTVSPTTQVIYCKTLNQCLSVCNLFRFIHDDDYSVWSFDCEWYVDYIPGKTNPISLIQYSRGDIVILFHISVYGLPQELVEILLNPRIIKVGVNINGDLQKLMRDFPSQFQNQIPSGCDLRRLSEVSGVPPSLSLAGMVENELGLELPKPEDTRCSNWETFPLTQKQLFYATQDVVAGYLLYQKIIQRWKQNRGIADTTAPIPFHLTPNQSNLPLAIDGKISDSIYAMILKNSIFSPHRDTAESGQGTKLPSHFPDPLDTTKRPKPSNTSDSPFESIVIPGSPFLFKYLNSVLSTDFHTSCSSTLSTSGSIPRYLSSKLQCYALWMSGHTITEIMRAKSIKLSTLYSYLLDCIDINVDSSSSQPLSSSALPNAKKTEVQKKNGMEYSITQFDISFEMVTSLISMYLTLIRNLEHTLSVHQREDAGIEKENHINESISLNHLNGIKVSRIIPFKDLKDLYATHGVSIPPDWMIRLVSIHCRRKIGNDWIEKLSNDEWLSQQIETFQQES